MRHIITILISVLVLSGTAQQQKTYRSMHGKLGLTIYWGDTLVNMGSNEMTMVLDPDTREFWLRLDPSTLRANSDSMNALIRENAFRTVEFSGKVEDSYIDLEAQDNDRFTVVGKLTINNITKTVELPVEILHWSEQAMSITHMMKIHYHVQLDDFELREEVPGLADFACIEIMQPVLRELDR